MSSGDRMDGWIGRSPSHPPQRNAARACSPGALRKEGRRTKSEPPPAANAEASLLAGRPPERGSTDEVRATHRSGRAGGASGGRRSVGEPHPVEDPRLGEGPVAPGLVAPADTAVA